ncbi:hypothetical protein L0Z72_11525 [candidate division KSB1 bacterium]|nr:hypothetical protein [candidate division KSB1 bacterium]
MRTLAKNKIIALGVMLIFLFGLTTCDKEPTEPNKNTAPELPPVQSMQIDLSYFHINPNQSLQKSATSKWNFLAAITTVSYINTFVIAASVAPSLVFATAMSQQPKLQDDAKFHWIYSASDTILGKVIAFEVDLVGWIDETEQESVWEVYVSSNNHSPQLNHFLWYQGRSEIGNKKGWWLFHDDKSPDSLIDVLKVAWDLSDENDKELIFTNVTASSNEYGDYLKYGIEFSDRYLIFFDASENKTNTIYWNAETGAGFIEWQNYNNGAKSYWDENHNDISGPPA